MSKSKPDLLAVGERRHETCRFGRLTEQWEVDPRTGKETPGTAPLCTWEPEGDVPPAHKRVWGGIIELDRDCAVCFAYRELPAARFVLPPKDAAA
ncbi:hypothetical protein D869_gp031 [Caulobacter phage CcrRogue]|uniref:Uncharacterized protein n=1 Tax=Caulobacter phage CcrRogue TaxID=2927986 RepID=K4JS09_9CAUD|nr:hypothetical protein D869_gp031 [Caulobacter phage CcrRogue]AFU86513.1 hypothetical protein CcrRogue_gp031 [Caulobacter phage CcrRogue]